MLQSPPKKENAAKPSTSKSERSKKRKLAKGKDQRVGEIIFEEPDIEYVEFDNLDDKESNTSPPKGATTAHFIKFMNELLDIMDLGKKFKRFLFCYG